MNMYVGEKSDSVVVLMKPPNKEGLPSAEGVEGRTLPEGNGDQTAAVRTQRRVTASNFLIAVRRAGRHAVDARCLEHSYRVRYSTLTLFPVR